MAWVVKNETKTIQGSVLCVSVAPGWSVWWALRPGRSGAFRFKLGLPTLFSKAGIKLCLTAIKKSQT